jgi:hypothetical protein
MAPRVFVSSVVEGFAEYRHAARAAIERAGGEALLVNEDFPALNASSRNACLDAVDSCDAFILLIGARGGWRAPSGKLVVEEELERARKRKLPALIFIQDCERDSDAEKLVRSVSDYVHGYFRAALRTPEDLEREAVLGLKPILSAFAKPTMDQNEIQELLKTPPVLADQATLRFVLAPERPGEVIDPLELDSAEFLHGIYSAAHAPDVGLLGYRHSKQEQVTSEALIVHQGSPGNWQQGIHEVRLEMRSSGVIIIDCNVTGRTPRQGLDMMSIFVLAHEGVEAAMAADFAFAASHFDALDPYLRHQRFFCNVALSGVGYRRLERAPQPRNSYAAGFGRSDNGPIVPFQSPRLLDRRGLKQPAEEIRRFMAAFARHPDLQ